MAKPKNMKYEQKPLSEIVQERRSYYENKMKKIFDVIYQRENFEKIEQFENLILTLSEKAIQGNLEGKLISGTSKPIKSDVKEQTLDYTTYINERNLGLSHEQIKEKYNVSGIHLRGYAGCYGKYEKQRNDRRPRLTSYKYAKERDAGLSNEQIKEKYRMDNPHQISGFGRWYIANKKKSK